MHTARSVHRLLAVVVILTASYGASAQSQAAIAPPGSPPAAGIAPPSPRLDAHWITATSDTMLITRDAGASPVADQHSRAGVRAISDRVGRVTVGLTIQAIRRVRYAERDAFQIDFEQRDSASIVDRTTTWVDATSLKPLAQTSHLEDGRIAIVTFVNDSVVIVDAAPGRAPQRFAAALPESAYTAAAIDLVLRALPLRDSYRTTLPIYFPAEQYVFPLAVRVEGTQRLTTRNGRLADCWVLAGEFPGGITERFWIDQSSHALIRILAHEAPTALIRYDR